MKAIFVLASLLCLLGRHPHCNAAIFERDWKSPGDGLLTLDDVNQREWLDLSETQLSMFPGANEAFQFQAVISETQQGGIFQGFRLAEYDDVDELARSAGIDTSTNDYETDLIAAMNLIRLLGHDVTDYGSYGALSVFFGGRSSNGFGASILVNPDSFAGLRTETRFISSEYGVWLFRAVPEPSAHILAGMAFLGALTWRR